MKKILSIVAVIAAIAATPALAFDNATTIGGGSASASNSSSLSGAGAASTNAGNFSGNTTTYEAQDRNPVSTAFAAPLTSSNDTCMGSTSVGGQGVGFGLSVGTTWTDKNCILLKNSREMWNQQHPKAAFARLCMDDANREAFETAGDPCPVKPAKVAEAAAPGKTIKTGTSAVDNSVVHSSK